MAVFSHVGDHRLKRLRVAVVVVLVHELDGSETAQVVERLLKRQSEASPELSSEDERPLHFVCDAVCQNCRWFVFSGTKLIIILQNDSFFPTFLNSLGRNKL